MEVADCRIGVRARQHFWPMSFQSWLHQVLMVPCEAMVVDNIDIFQKFTKGVHILGVLDVSCVGTLSDAGVPR